MKSSKLCVPLQVHPVNEALFNLVGAWGMMLLPLMLQDKRAGHVKKKWTIWTATMVSTLAIMHYAGSCAHDCKLASQYIF